MNDTVDTLDLNPVRRDLVSEEERLDMLPRFFGERWMMRAEALVFQWMGVLSKDYHGGYWHFYTLSNGGFYMAPNLDGPMTVEVTGNGYQGRVSPDAAGIIAVLFAASQLAGESRNIKHIDVYHDLRDFARNHPESAAIFAAID